MSGVLALERGVDVEQGLPLPLRERVVGGESLGDRSIPRPGLQQPGADVQGLGADAQSGWPRTPEVTELWQLPASSLREKIAARDVSPVELARREGPFVILTADNPYSRVLSDDENNRRRSELHDLLHRHALIHRPTLARDPAGLFPSEKGFAIWGLAEDSVAAWARAFDQHAVYEVNPDGLVVRAAR